MQMDMLTDSSAESYKGYMASFCPLFLEIQLCRDQGTLVQQGTWSCERDNQKDRIKFCDWNTNYTIACFYDRVSDHYV